MQKSGFFWWGEIMKIVAQVLYKICGQDDVKKVRFKVTFWGHNLGIQGLRTHHFIQCKKPCIRNEIK